SKPGHLGNYLLEQLKSFAAYLRGHLSQPRDVSTWPREASDEARRHWIADVQYSDGNCAGCFLDCKGLTRRPDQDSVNLKADQLGCESGKTFGFSFCISVFNVDVLPLNMSKLVQTLPEGIQEVCTTRSRTAFQVADAVKFPRLLRFDWMD